MCCLTFDHCFKSTWIFSSVTFSYLGSGHLETQKKHYWQISHTVNYSQGLCLIILGTESSANKRRLLLLKIIFKFYFTNGTRKYTSRLTGSVLCRRRSTWWCLAGWPSSLQTECAHSSSSGTWKPSAALSSCQRAPWWYSCLLCPTAGWALS